MELSLDSCANQRQENRRHKETRKEIGIAEYGGDPRGAFGGRWQKMVFEKDLVGACG